MQLICHLHNVFHVDVLRKASTPSPLQQGPLNVGPETEDVEGQRYIVEEISDVKFAPFGRKWLQFLVHYASYPKPEWSLLSDVDDLEALYLFYASATWRAFSDGRRLTLLVNLSAGILPYAKFNELKGGGFVGVL